MKQKIIPFLLALLLLLPSCVGKTETESTAADSETAAESTEIAEIFPLTEEEAEISDTKYAYFTLSESDRELYRRIYASVESGVYRFSLAEDPTVVFKCLYADCPELVMLTGESKYSNGIFDMAAYMTHAEYLTVRATMEEKAAEYASLIPEGADSFRSLITVFQNFIIQVSYDTKAEDGFDKGSKEAYVKRALSAEGALLHDEAICEGYARAYLYLIQSLGFTSSTVSGNTVSGYHAWLIFEVNGRAYHCDPTWADANDATVAEKINYAYFAMTDEEIAYSKTPETAYELPVCDSLNMNYYVNEGLYFTACDPEAVLDLLIKAHGEGVGEICFQFPEKSLVTELYLLCKNGGLEDLFGPLPFNYIVSTHSSLRLLAFRFV